MPICISCAAPVLGLRDFGTLPLTNRYSDRAHAAVPKHPLILGQCEGCGLVQLVGPAPPSQLKPPRPILYREPEGHLDSLVDLLLTLPGIHCDSRVCGLTYKEASTLERLLSRGFRHLINLDPRDDFGIGDEAAGLETIQSRITRPWAAQFVERQGTFPLVLARHLLEHAQDPAEFLAAVQQLVAPGGYIVLEAPDCTTMFRSLDYSFLWEEHVSYFTPNTLRHVLRRHGLVLSRELLIYPRPLENTLVAIASRGERETRCDPSAVATELVLGHGFADHFPTVRSAWRQRLRWWQSQGQIALLGAGHLATMFLHVFELSEIDYVCDDAPEKLGSFVSGTGHRILPTSILAERPVKLCLLAVAPESESRVRSQQQAFTDRGGQFASIFAASRQALPGVHIGRA